MATRIIISTVLSFIFLSFPVFSSEKLHEEITLNKLCYIKMDDGWYVKGINNLFKVAENSISARLADSRDRDSVLKLTKSLNLNFIRENRLNIMDFHLSAGSDIMKTVTEMYQSGYFLYVEPNVTGKYSAIPDDPDFSNCWGLHNTGQSGGTSDADIDAPEAWDRETGNSGITVAILDSGTDYTHEDLAANIWNNSDEIPGNGIDDDGNGRIDDIVGWDFEHNDNDPSGSYYHGTHVAGCVAAVNNNGAGISAVAGGWGTAPGASMMICLIGSSGPIGEIIDDAIIYAADNGAQIITMSFSITPATAITDAVAYAYTAGAFIDCASGNDSAAVGYPANLTAVCAIGATDHNDIKADFSNYGPELELTAPGVDIFSTQMNNSYGYSSGTSFAAPYVAGVAAAVLSSQPAFTNQELRELMRNTSEDLGEPGFDNNYGYGRVNMFSALQDIPGLTLNRKFYSCQDTIEITVKDDAASGSVSVVVTSTTETSAETVVLTETRSGRFSGSILCDSIPAQSGDAILSVNNGDLISADYTPLSAYKTAVVDCIAPVITQLATGQITDSKATIEFTTNEACFGSVVYGLTTPDLQVDSELLRTDHSIVIPNLDPCTQYEFYVMATDPAGNTTTDDNGGFYYSFSTYQLTTILNADMTVNPGWSYEGEWAYGIPLGNDGDPDSGYTGTNVVGFNLSGTYTNNLPETYCTTTTFDCTDSNSVFLCFYRWLGVESAQWDHAGIEISNNGGISWAEIWNHTGSSLEGGSWDYVEYDISAEAAGSSNVMIRWIMGTTDSSMTYCGWNIDDVLVSTTVQCEEPTATPLPCNNDGDVNQDGSITASDAQRAFQIVLGIYSPSYTEECSANCNGDALVTASDAQLIFLTALGSDSCVDPI